METAKQFYERHTALAWVLAFAIPILVVVVGVKTHPEVFYDRFVWQDLWGPLVLDAHQCRTPESCPGVSGPADVDVKDGYTITSEIVYGLVLAALLYLIYTTLFQRYRVTADGWFVLGLLPFIFLGPLARVLEDADVFCRADSAASACSPGVFAYGFISPVIYMNIAVFVLLFLVLGKFLEHRREGTDPRLLGGAIAALLAAMTAAYGLLHEAYAVGFSAMPPVWVVAISAALGAGFFWDRARKGMASANAATFSLGLPFALPSLYLIATWLRGGPHIWSDRAWSGFLFPQAAAAMVGLAASVTFVVAAIGLLARRRNPAHPLAQYALTFNLALVFGHMLDAFATWIALKDPFQFGIPGYTEKHPLSDFLLTLGDGWGFPIAKLTMILAVIWLLGREFKDERPGDRNLVGLIKMAIFVLGFAPGLRDLLRVAMGV